MATLITGQSQLLTLQPNDKYTVTVGANAEAYIDLGAGTDGSGYDSVRLTSEGTNKYTIGEYGRVAKVTIRCVVGSVDYIQGQTQSTPAIVQYAKYNLPRFDQMTAHTTTGATVQYDQSYFGGLGGIKYTPSIAAPVVKRQLASPIDLSATKTIQIGVENNNPAGANTVSVIFYFSTDLSTDWAIYNIDLRGAPNGGDCAISINKATRNNQSASYADSMWATVRGIGIVQNGQTPSADTWFLLSNIVTETRYTPSVFLSMDGSYIGQFTYGIPLLEKYGLNGAATIFMRRDILGGATSATMAQIKAANDAGYPVGLHSNTKLLDTTVLANFPTAQSITDEINDFHSWAATQGLKTLREVQPIANQDPFAGTMSYADSLARAQGYANAGVKRLRLGNQAYNAGRMNNDAFFKGAVIRTYPLVAATLNSDIDAWLQVAIDRQELISIYFHNVLLSGATGSSCNYAQVEYLASKIADFKAKGMLNTANPLDMVD